MRKETECVKKKIRSRLVLRSGGRASGFRFGRSRPEEGCRSISLGASWVQLLCLRAARNRRRNESQSLTSPRKNDVFFILGPHLQAARKSIKQKALPEKQLVSV